VKIFTYIFTKDFLTWKEISMGRANSLKLLVPEARLELAQAEARGILSLID
jgi:hypothetical protein